MAEEEKFATDYDGPWKDALDFAPDAFLQRFLGRIAEAIDWRKPYQSLDHELRQVVAQEPEGIRRVDRLLLFETLSEDPLYLHIEVQCYHEKELGRRVMTYRHRLRARFDKPVVTVIIFGDGRRRWCPKKHQEGQFGSGDSCVWLPIKLLELWRENPDLENEENVFGLFIVAHLETLATRKDLPGRRQAKLRLLSNLQRRKMDEADGREWYRLIDWIMKLPEDMNRQVHAELYRKHTEEPMKYVSFAERQGIEKGIEKGIERGARKALETVMEAKFGPEGKALVQRLGESTDLARLDALTRAAALALSLDDVRRDFEAPNGQGQAEAAEKTE
jgi:hypothetical protein